MATNKLPVALIISWVLTLKGADIALQWIGRLVESIVQNSPTLQTTSPATFATIGASLQIFAYIISLVLAIPALKNKDYKFLAVVAIAVNSILILHILVDFIMLVLSGHLTY